MGTVNVVGHQAQIWLIHQLEINVLVLAVKIVILAIHRRGHQRQI